MLRPSCTPPIPRTAPHDQHRRALGRWAPGLVTFDSSVNGWERGADNATIGYSDTVEFPEGGEANKIRRHIRGTQGLTDTTQQVTDWSYASGIGQILIVIGSRTDPLLSLRTVAVQPATWTRIRMLRVAAAGPRASANADWDGAVPVRATPATG